MEERLQKLISRAGVASRRKSEGLILQKRVTVNGRVVSRLGVRVDPVRDHVKVDGKRIRPQPLESYVFYKPKKVLSAVSDPSRRPVVTQLIPSKSKLYPAGRLDFHSEGLIILTNDGALAVRLIDSSLQKVYQVKVKGRPAENRLDRLRRGTRIEGRKFLPCEIILLKAAPNPWYKVVLEEGKNRQIRRMFQSIGHPVQRIRRIAVGPILLGHLKAGEYRRLTHEERSQVMGTSMARRTKRSHPSNI